MRTRSKRAADEQPAEDQPERMVARAMATITSSGETLTPEDFDRVRSNFGDPRANVRPEHYYGFRLAASSDGLDFYFTKPDPKTSLVNYVEDLKVGQSVLGSHSIDTFSYGTSYDAALTDLDPSSPIYEAAFYRQYSDRPELRTTQAVVGSYVISRGLELNGEKTDSIIRGIELGNIRKVSIGFTVGKYVCGIDGKDMMAGWFGVIPDMDEGCAHFPGVDYGEDGPGWALMVDNDMMETSLVYKNASPSALYFRKAAELARHGILSIAQIGGIEERLQMRLPRHERRLWTPGSTERSGMRTRAKRDTDETKVEDQKGTAAEDDTEDEDDAEGQADDATAAEDRAAAGDEADEDEDEEDASEEERQPEGRHAGHSHDGDTKGGHLKSKKEEEDDDERQPSGRLALLEAQRSSIAKIIGREPTVAAIKALKRDADLGATLFDQIVDEAVKARVRSLGQERFGTELADKYRAQLTRSRDVEYVLAEIELNGGANPFKAGRQVPGQEPAEAAERKPRSRRPTTAPEDDNIFDAAAGR